MDTLNFQGEFQQVVSIETEGSYPFLTMPRQPWLSALILQLQSNTLDRKTGSEAACDVFPDAIMPGATASANKGSANRTGCRGPLGICNSLVDRYDLFTRGDNKYRDQGGDTISGQIGRFSPVAVSSMLISVSLISLQMESGIDKGNIYKPHGVTNIQHF
jgi:hypothetical protein